MVREAKLIMFPAEQTETVCSEQVSLLSGQTCRGGKCGLQIRLTRVSLDSITERHRSGPRSVIEKHPQGGDRCSFKGGSKQLSAILGHEGRSRVPIFLLSSKMARKMSSERITLARETSKNV